MHLWRTVALGLTALALPAVLLATPSARAETIEVLCSVHEWCSIMQQTFKNATGFDVRVTEISSRKALDTLRSQHAGSRYDLWYGGTIEYHLEAAREELTLPYRSPNNSLLHTWGSRLAQQTGYHTNGLYSGPLGLVYNTAALKRAHIDPPRCWSDLIKPEYRGKIEVSKPSGMYSVIATLVQMMGEDDAFDYLAKLHRNLLRYPATGKEVLADVDAESASIGIAFVYGANANIADGKRLVMVAPCEGTGYEVGGMSIVKGGPNPNGAKRLFDWALTSQAQHLFTSSRQFQAPSNSSGRTDGRSGNGSGARLIDYDFIKYGNLAERARLLGKWNTMVLRLGGR